MYHRMYPYKQTNADIMKKSTLLGTFLAIALLVGCGGSSSTDPEPTPTPVQAAKTPKVICLTGDSTQIGKAHLDGELAAMVSTVYPGSTVLNFGVSGSVTEQGINGIYPMAPSIPDIIATYHCDVLTSNYGINDAAKLNTSPERYLSLIHEINGIAVANGVKYIVETPNPTLVGWLNPRLEGYVAMVYGSGLAYVDHWTNILSTGGWEAWMLDGVHPGDEIHRIKNAALAKKIIAVLGA